MAVGGSSVPKSLWFRLFGVGRLPRRWREACASEGVVLLEEGLALRVGLRHFRAPGRYSSGRVSYGAGALLLTERRLLITLFWRKVVDLPRQAAWLGRLSVGLDEQGRLLLAFHAEAFSTRQRGEVALRLTSEHAAWLLAELRAQGARAWGEGDGAPTQ